MSIISLLNAIPNNATTIQEILKAGRMDFTAEMRPGYYLDTNGNPNLMGSCKAVVKKEDDSYIWHVGNKYSLVQYKDSFSICEAMINEPGVKAIAASCIGNGSQGFVIMKTPEFLEIAPGDKIECYFYLSASHDGTGSITGSLIPLRHHSVATLPYRPFKIRHTSGAADKLTQAKQALDKIRNYWNSTVDNFKSFSRIKLTEEQVVEYLKMVVEGDSTRADNVRSEILTVYGSSDINKYPSTNGTLLGAYFSVIDWVDAEKQVRKSKKRNEDDAMIHAKLVGAGATQKAEAYAFAIELIKKFE